MPILGIDKRTGAPVHRVTSISNVDISGSNDYTRWLVSPNELLGERLWLDNLFVKRSSPTLLVIFHGAQPRRKYQHPRFEYLSTFRDRPESQLYISDGGLQLATDLALSWYVGTTTDVLPDRLITLIDSFREQANARRILLFGGSGGGFAALAVAHRLPGSIALVFSPQTRVGNYYPRHVRRFIAACFPEYQDYSDVEANHLDRLSLVNRFHQNPPIHSRIWYVQNSGDHFHHEKHMKPFAETFGVGPEGGVSPGGAAMFKVENLREGHGMAPKDYVLNSIDKALAWDMNAPT